MIMAWYSENLKNSAGRENLSCSSAFKTRMWIERDEKEKSP